MGIEQANWVVNTHVYIIIIRCLGAMTPFDRGFCFRIHGVIDPQTTLEWQGQPLGYVWPFFQHLPTFQVGKLGPLKIETNP